MNATTRLPRPLRLAASALEWALLILAVLALALAPTQLTVAVENIPLAPAELALALAAVVWMLRWLIVRDTRSLPPLPYWLLVLASVLSVFAVGVALRSPEFSSLAASVGKETAQLFLYVVAATTVFRAVFTSPGRVRAGVIALLATTSLAVLLGVAQRALLMSQYEPDAAKRTVFASFTRQAYATVETPAHVCSTFGSWNGHGFHPSRTAYAGFLALTLPFALALIVSDRRHFVVLFWMGLLFAGVAFSLLAGYLVPGILIGLCMTAVALGRKPGRVAPLLLLAYLLALSVAGGMNRAEVLEEPVKLTISAAESDDGQAHLKKFWGEQFAALNVFWNHPLVGVGAGQYQRYINMGWGHLGAVSSQRLESDAQNGYLLTAVSTGAVGLGALLLLLGSSLRLAWRRLRQEPTNPWRAAALGAVVTLAAITLATNPWIRGTMVVIAFLLAVSGADATPSVPARIEQKGDF